MPEYDKKDGEDYPWERERLYDNHLNNIEEGIENNAKNTIQYGSGPPDTVTTVDEDNSYYIDTDGTNGWDIYYYDGFDWILLDRNHDHDGDFDNIPNDGLVNSEIEVAENTVSLGGSTTINYVDLDDTGDEFPIRNIDIHNDYIELTGGNAIDSIGTIDLGGSASIDVSSGGIGSDEIATGAVGLDELEKDSIEFSNGHGIDAPTSATLGDTGITFDVNVSDFDGSYLSDDGTNTLQVNISSGLKGVGDDIIVNANDLAGTLLSQDGTNDYQLNVDEGDIDHNKLTNYESDEHWAGDDTAGSGDTDKVWSADKTYSEISDVDSDLNNHIGSGGTGEHPVVTSTTEGFMRTDDYDKLDGIESGATNYDDSNVDNHLSGGSYISYSWGTISLSGNHGSSYHDSNVVHDGESTNLTGLDMNNNRITNLDDPDSDSDAATQNWVYNNTINLTTLDSGTITIDADDFVNVNFENPNNKPYIVSWRVVNNYRSRMAKMHKAGSSGDDETLVFTNLQEDFSTDVEYKIYTVE